MFTKPKTLFLFFLLAFNVSQEQLKPVEISTKTARIIDGIAFFGPFFALPIGSVIAFKKSARGIRELICGFTFLSSFIIFYFTHKYIHTITPTGKFLKKFHVKFDQLYSEESINHLLNQDKKEYESLNKNKDLKVKIKKLINLYIEIFKSLLKEVTPELNKDAKFYEDSEIELQSTIYKIDNILLMLTNILNKLC